MRKSNPARTLGISPIAGSWEEAVSYERGTPVLTRQHEAGWLEPCYCEQAARLGSSRSPDQTPESSDPRKFTGVPHIQENAPP